MMELDLIKVKYSLTEDFKTDYYIGKFKEYLNNSQYKDDTAINDIAKKFKI